MCNLTCAYTEGAHAESASQKKNTKTQKVTIHRKRMKNIRLLGDQFFSTHPKAMYCLFAAPTGLCLKLEVRGPLI